MPDEEKTVDLRVKRTRRLLQQALMELMAEHSFQSITVQRIAEQAMVNRATFYDHFVDKYALLEYSINEWFKDTVYSKVPDDGRFSADHLQLLVVTTCEFLSVLRNHCSPRTQELLPVAQTQITIVIQEILALWLQKAQPRASFDGAPGLAATVASWAIYGTALHWSQGNRREPVDAYAAGAINIIMAGLNEAVEIPVA